MGDSMKTIYMPIQTYFSLCRTRRSTPPSLKRLAILTITTCLGLVFADYAHAQDKTLTVVSAQEPLGSKEECSDFHYEIISKAFGYASCYNIPKANEILTPILSDPSVATKCKGRALWVQAYAYISFMVEYRTSKYEEDYQQVLKRIRTINPSLLFDQLPSKYATYRFHVPETTSPQVMDERLSELLREAEKEPDTSLKTVLQACAYNVAAMVLGEEASASRGYLESALQKFREASEMRRDNYFANLWYVDVLARLKKKTETNEAAQLLVDRFKGRTVLYDDDSPASKQWVYDTQFWSTKWEIKSGRDKYIAKYSNDPAFVCDKELSDIRQLANESTTPTLDQLKYYETLAEQWEGGGIPAWRLHRLATLYYKLAHLYNQIDDCHKSLEMYRKLQRISPDYAELHLNTAIILASLSENEKDKSVRLSQLQEAISELVAQKKLNYHGGNSYVDKAIQIIEKKLHAIK